MIDDAFFYTTNQNSVAKEDWKKLSDTDDVTTESQVYVSVDYTIYHEYDSEGLIIRKGMMSKEMGGGNPFN